MEYKSAIKDAIEELKYSIEPNQGFMECRTGTISEETIRMAIEALEKQMQNCGNCLRADRIPNYHLIYCRVHNSVTSDDNCCRYWVPLE